MRRGYDRVKGSICRSYDEIEGMTVSVSRNFHMLSEITTSKKVGKLDCLSIAEVVNMDVKVASNNEFMRGCGTRTHTDTHTHTQTHTRARTHTHTHTYMHTHTHIHKHTHTYSHTHI